MADRPVPAHVGQGDGTAGQSAAAGGERLSAAAKQRTGELHPGHPPGDAALPGEK